MADLLNEAPDSEVTVRQYVEPILKAGMKVGDYVVEHVLGEGGFGTVYAATHPLIGKRAAIKVLNKDLSSDEDMVSRFVAEARAVNTIRQENIVDIFNIGTLPDGRYYFVMELLEGQSFEEHLIDARRIGPEQLMQIVRGVANALDAAHAAGIVHRDIKPGNIFLHREPNGSMTPKLVDFGVAKLTGAAKQMSHHQTATGTPIGTPQYMSPEQCFGREIDCRTDIYALGIVCYEALTGESPFDGDSLLQLMNKHTLGERPTASVAWPNLGTAFDEPLKSMMAIDPDDRPGTASEAIQLLDYALVGRAPAPPTLQHGGRGTGDTPTNLMPLPPPTGSPMSGPYIADDPAAAAITAPFSSSNDRARKVPGGKQNTLGATASGVNRAKKNQNRRILWFAAAALLTFAVVALGVVLTGGSPGDANLGETSTAKDEATDTGASAAAQGAPTVSTPPREPASAVSAVGPASATASAAPSAAPTVSTSAKAPVKPVPRRRRQPIRRRRPKPKPPSNPYDHP